MTEGQDHFIRLQEWCQGSSGTVFFEYYVLTQGEEELVWVIRIERMGDALHADKWRKILDEPEHFIKFEDLNGNGKDDLKILSENRPEEVYVACLWDGDLGQSPYPSWAER